MAKSTLKDVYIEVDGNDISDHIKEITVTTSRDEVEVTGFGALNKEIIAGIGDATIELTALQDYAASSIDSIMEPLSREDTPFPIVIRPTSDPVSASNPNYTMSEALLFEYSPFAGSMGGANETPLKFRNAGQNGIVRTTA